MPINPGSYSGIHALIPPDAMNLMRLMVRLKMRSVDLPTTKTVGTTHSRRLYKDITYVYPWYFCINGDSWDISIQDNRCVHIYIFSVGMVVGFSGHVAEGSDV